MYYTLSGRGVVSSSPVESRSKKRHFGVTLMSSTHTVGLVTNNFESLYHTPMLQMLHARLCERGYRLLGIMGTPGEIASNRVASDRVDGWLVINTTAGVEMLSSTGKPLVLVGGV